MNESTELYDFLAHYKLHKLKQQNMCVNFMTMFVNFCSPEADTSTNAFFLFITIVLLTLQSYFYRKTRQHTDY